MIDPALVRDHMDVVRSGLESRGQKMDRGSRSAGRARSRTPEAPAGGRRTEARAEYRRRGSREGQAAGARSVGDLRHQQGTGAADQATRGRARSGRSAAERTADDAAEPAGRERPARRLGRGQPGSAAVGHDPELHVRAEAALGPGPGTRHPRFRARGADVRRTVFGVDGGRGAPRPRAHQLHARVAHDRARVHRGGAAVPGQRRRPPRHRQPPEIRAGPVQDCRRVGSLPDPDRRSAADQPVSDRDPRRPSAAAALHRLHAVLSQAKRDRTAPMSAA